MGVVHTIGLVLHPRRDPRRAIDEILRWAREYGATVLALPDEVSRVDSSVDRASLAELTDRSSLLVSLGGDGTMLRTMRLIAGKPTPILGVNLGRLGFLAEIDVPELFAALTEIDVNHHFVEPRLAVRTELPDGETVTAFNDIALVRVPGRGVAAVGVSVQDHPFVRYAADAVIVATSTGSTAYSFSAGGPIVSPRVQGLLVVPAAAHSSFSRALVIPLDERLVLEVLPASGELAVEVDGQVAGYVSPGQHLPITAVPAAAQVVRLGNTTFYERARRKLRVNDSASAELD